MIISFHADAIAECKKQLPHIKALWLCRYKEQKNGRLTPGVEEVAATLKRIQADGFNSQAVPEHFDEAFIKRLREWVAASSACGPWTTRRSPSSTQQLGAWSITTNRPGWLREAVESTSKAANFAQSFHFHAQSL